MIYGPFLNTIVCDGVMTVECKNRLSRVTSDLFSSSLKENPIIDSISPAISNLNDMNESGRA